LSVSRDKVDPDIAEFAKEREANEGWFTLDQVARRIPNLSLPAIRKELNRRVSKGEMERHVIHSNPIKERWRVVTKRPRRDAATVSSNRDKPKGGVIKIDLSPRPKDKAQPRGKN
jgi:hypothetical protein